MTANNDAVRTRLTALGTNTETAARNLAAAARAAVRRADTTAGTLNTFRRIADSGDLWHNGERVWASELYPLAASEAEFPAGSMIAAAVAAQRRNAANRRALAAAAELLDSVQ